VKKIRVIFRMGVDAGLATIEKDPAGFIGEAVQMRHTTPTAQI
jgi:hypothetical protein